MSNLTVKEVNFNGDTLVAAQDKITNKVYVGVRWVCEGIGLSNGQARRQVENLREDIVLSKGITYLRLEKGTGKGSVQDVLCIELDFLPLWLAKISITPKMKKDSPEVVEKLIDYQLKAKEVLANAFIHNVKQIVPKTYKEALYALIESIEERERLEAENQKLLPKAKKFDMFIDGVNVQKMNDVAKILGYGRNKLFQFLRDQKVLMKDNRPYQTFIDRGYFKVKETPIQKGGKVVNIPQTYVTAKGVDFIDDLLKEKGIERII